MRREEVYGPLLALAMAIVVSACAGIERFESCMNECMQEPVYGKVFQSIPDYQKEEQDD